MDFSLLQRKKAVVHKGVPMRWGWRRNKIRFFQKKDRPEIFRPVPEGKNKDRRLPAGQDFHDPDDRYTDHCQKE